MNGGDSKSLNDNDNDNDNSIACTSATTIATTVIGVGGAFRCHPLEAGQTFQEFDLHCVDTASALDWFA